MRRTRRMHMPVVGLVAIVAALVLAGCGGGNNPPPQPTGGTVTGRTVEARTGLGIGGVLVEIMSGGTPVASGTSTTPNGDFAVQNVPPGTYTTIRVTPDPVIGPQQTVTLATPITVAVGSVIPIGTILVLDDEPPAP